MTVPYVGHLTNRRATLQSEPIPGETQIENNAGGYVYEIDAWAQLDRFLILGAAGGTYYVSERKLTRENAAAVERCLAEDGYRVVDAIVAVSDAGRAPSNEPAIFALALAASVKAGDARGRKYTDVRAYALAHLRQVCRIPTHLFHFVAARKALAGVSRGLRTAVGAWYRGWAPEQLAYELAKYQARDGWSNRDVLRQAHPTLPAAVQPVLRWVIGGANEPREVKRRNAAWRIDRYEAPGPLPEIVAALEEAKTASPDRLDYLIRAHNLTREMIPSAALNEARHWESLLQRMPLGALIRSLAKMTSVGLLAPMGASTRQVTDRLTSAEYLRKSRVHPMAVLNALRVYASGHGEKGKLAWGPVREVVDALDAAFYLAFGNVTPTGKRLLLALDVSGSMTSQIAGTGLSCREASAALALVTANVEPHWVAVGFTNTGTRQSQYPGYMAGLSELSISPRQRLDDVVAYLAQQPFGGTDCALPWIYAREQKLEIDAALTFTDSETWAGAVHPSQALRQYRQALNRPHAASVVVGMTATEFSVADPKDPRSLDVVGFDLATPQAISAFVAA